MDGPSPEVALTRLAGGPQLSSAELEAFSGDVWQVVAERAAQHRVEPLLHYRWKQHGSIPDDISARWAQAYRESAISALAHKAELLWLGDLFASQGIAAVALKGAWLAWHVYPEPALRPLRDLDLLVPHDKALQARSLLLAHGWHEEGTDGLCAAQWLARFKHLPPLVSPGGIVAELHVKLWDDDGRMPPDPAGVISRAKVSSDHPALLFPEAMDLLMHLAVHAAFHRFDGGPLMLADFDRLLARVRYDWPAVWRRADAEGWSRMLALALAATQRWAPIGIDNIPQLPLMPPEEVIGAIPQLLAKPLAERDADISAARQSRPDITVPEKLRRLLARRERFDSASAYLSWVLRQIGARRSDRLAAMTAMDAWLLG